MLVQCDADNHTAAMKELTKIALINGYTLMTCWRLVGLSARSADRGSALRAMPAWIHQVITAG